MRRKRHMNTSQKLNTVLAFFAGMAFVTIVAVVVISMQTKATSTQRNEGNYTQNEGVEEEEKWQEGIISYNGKNYKYNDSLRTYLFMGIDNDNPVTTATDSISGGQSDAMFLLVTNKETESMTIISINRNTMTKVAMYDASGNSLGDSVAQICVQHGFGDGKKLSCSRSVDAVSHLFYNIPISGYMAINMGAIPKMNDAIGGVSLTVLQDLYYPSQGVELFEGETVTLNGDEAYYYLRGRDINEFDSATDRLRRQEQYIMSYMSKLKSIASGDVGKLEDVYNSISDYLVTNVDFVSMLGELMEYDFSDERMYTVPGETHMGTIYEEYHVDEEALYDLIIEVFYEEVS